MGIGVSELLLILVIVLVVFGTKRLRSIGGDLGGAIKSFRSAMNEPENEKPQTASPADAEDDTDKKPK